MQENNGENFLENLSKGSYENAVEKLQQMRGIGAKVSYGDIKIVYFRECLIKLNQI